MSTNLVRAVKLLSVSPEHLDTATHDSVLKFILEDKNFPPGKLFAEIIHLVDNKMPEQYWTATFEALIVAHYDEAGEMVKAALKNLTNRRPTVRMYPLVILGFLRAANWCEVHAETPNKQFVDTFPDELARLLLHYAHTATTEVLQDAETTQWYMGQFSSELSTYFDAKLMDVRRHRMSAFCGTLCSVSHIGPNARRVMAEVSGRLMHKLDLVNQLAMLTTYHLNSPNAHSCVNRG